jgi:hypothetical protein
MGGNAMTVGEGQFLLYSYLTPALKAGHYRFTASQQLSAAASDGSALGANDLTVSDLQTHLDVTSPRYQLPPDQVLSAYPPANSEGSYGTRLPQIVIKRRTLPWERDAGAGGGTIPWLALVVIAEGEAELVLNQPVTDCVTPGVHLDGAPDVPEGNYLSVRKSVIDTIFPTQKDVPLLVHAREVDITDTEMMMGDDDGFLAVVIANRLPVPGRSPAGDEVPVKYLACLINLEGQIPALLPGAPEPTFGTTLPVVDLEYQPINVAEYDHIKMGNDPAYQRAQSSAGVAAPLAGAAAQAPPTKVSPDPVALGRTRAGQWDLAGAKPAESVYAEMAAPFGSTAGVSAGLLDMTYRFPALIHWSFTSTGETTFQTLMEDLDNGLLGTLPGIRPFGDHADDPDRTPQQLDGRPPPEIVETGHIGLGQRTRLGDEVRCWYRGPLLPHPADTDSPRIPLAHASDQLRTVIPDGREDLSLAVAFEIGRLLALSSPAMITALMSWRQNGYQVARLDTVWGGLVGELGTFLGAGFAIAGDLGVHFGRGLAKAVTTSPGETLGGPRELLTPGTPLPLDGLPLDLVMDGYGIAAAKVPGGDLLSTLGSLRGTSVPRLPLTDLAAGALTTTVRDELGGILDAALTQLTRDTLAPTLDLNPALGPTFAGWEPAAQPRRDALDEILDSGAKEDES